MRAVELEDTLRIMGIILSNLKMQGAAQTAHGFDSWD